MDALKIEAATQLTAILDSSDDAIIGKTLDNTIMSWSRGAERMYGYSAEEIVGRSITLLTPPDRTTEAAAIIQRISQGEQIRHLQTLRLTKAGERIIVSLNVSPLKNSDGEITGALTIARDVTMLEKSQESVRSHALLLDTASRVALDILSSRTGIEALRHIADAARVLVNARYAALGVAQPDGQSLSEFITVGLTPAEEAVIGPRPKGVGVLALLLHRTEPLRIDMLAQHPAAVGFPPRHPPMDSFLGVPIRRGQVVFGSLYLTNKQGGGAFTEEDEVAVQALGNHAAVAIHNLNMLVRQRALVSGLITAQEEERRAIAYDLHDGLTQFVMASHAHLEAFRRAHATGKVERATRELEQGLCYLKEAVVESRRLVNGLRSLALDDLGLAGALEQLVNEEKARTGWEQADLIHNITAQRFGKTLEAGVYRVVQEALTNARKHAATARVRVLLLLETDELTGTNQLKLQVRDWGQGFVPADKMGEAGRVGLHGMAERTHLLGGDYELQSAPGSGTTVRAVFPIFDLESTDHQPADGTSDAGGQP